ncbi:hypothetical protein GC102_07445 [Paenibacillus sp. LMG 31460]|uniref:F5/8 type C domain-containing protein n=1 Tax=Paenibacillus germinis TaxID=2654979 RepID=A0ABX1YXC0_9BACL|nr:discoidin domain-containing protein [Paenibacillus germinis]NOU85612.1 hypothetical protein [Paenibacillus germinis]
MLIKVIKHLIRFAELTVLALFLFIINPFVYNSVSAEETQPQKIVYISPSGSDMNGNGEENNPFQTITKARDTVREFISNHPMTGDIVVYLREGTYFQSTTITFGPEDSGQNGNNIIYKAYPGETPIISGGQPITGWQLVSEGLYKAPVGSLDFRQLYINDTRGVRARTPNTGSFYRLKSFDNANKTIKVNSSEAADLAGGSGTAEMIIQTHWADRHLLVDSVNAGVTETTITPREPERSQVIGNEAPKSESNQSYHFENKLAFLDKGGEWFLDKDSQEVYYEPRPGENMFTSVVIAPQLETIVKFTGTVDSPVHHIQFHDLNFEHSTWLKPNDGYAGVQATYYQVGGLWYGGKLPGAVQMEAAGNIRFERNTFKHLGATGLDLSYGNFDTSIVGNIFTDISGNGIGVASKLYTLTAAPEDPRVVDKRIQIQNNYISKIGQDYYSAVGVFGGYVEELTVEHNDITDTPYSGMSVGWGFTKTPTALKNNIIRNNHIYNVMNLMDDGGGIYTLSYQPGTQIKENYIHDVVRSPWTTVNAPDKEWWRNLGIYLDHSSSGMTVTNNVILNTERVIKTNIEPYGSNTFIRNHNDLQWVKDLSGIEPAYQDIRLTVPGNPPPAAPDAVPPTLLGASSDEAGTEILLNFNEPLEAISDSGVLDASKFILNGTTAVISSAIMDYTDVKNARVKLTLNETVGYGKTVTLTLAAGTIKDVALNSIQEVNGFSVTNNTLIPYFMKVSMVGSPNLHVGETAQIQAAFTTRDGQPVDLSQGILAYNTADSSIVTVNNSNGIATGVMAGETQVAVRFQIDGIEFLSNVNLLVIPAGTPRPELVNIAKGRPVTATSEYNSAFAASKANDDNINTAWVTAGTASWTVDLGEQVDLYRLRKIEFVTRQDANQNSSRANFEIRASNDSTFATFTLLGSQGPDVLPYRSTWSLDLTDTSSYRYLRFVKPVNYASVAELRVLAEPNDSLNEVSYLTVQPEDKKLLVTWEEPPNASFAGVKIYHDGTMVKSVPKGTKSAVIENLAGGVPYTFVLKTFDISGIESSGINVTRTPILVDDTGPTLVSAVTDETGKVITATFSEALDKAALQASSFTLGGTDAIVTAAALDGTDTQNKTVKLTLNKAVGYKNTIALSLSQGAVKDVALNPNLAINNFNVVNNMLIPYFMQLSMQGTPILNIGETAQIKAALTTRDGQPVDLSQAIYAFNAADSSIVTINNSNGRVTGAKAGETTVTVSVTIDGVEVRSIVNILVVAANTTKPTLLNIAKGKPATATSEYSSTYSASKANDNNINTVWITAGTASWTVDMGEQASLYRIRKIEFVTRQDADQNSSRINFEIRASNDSTFATYTVLGSQGAGVLPYKSTWSVDVTDISSYRYVRFVKPVNFAAVAELRVLAEPIVDSTPPVTTGLLEGTKSSDGTYTSDVMLTLTASDASGGSGIDKTEYSFDGTSWNIYNGPIAITNEGTTNVSFRSYDIAGNVETQHTITINIDKTAPTDATLAANITEPTNNDVSVTISYPADATTKEYKVGTNGAWTAYTAPVVVSENNTVYARGTDAVGNVSNVTNYEVSNIDHVAPMDATLAVDTTAPTNQGVTVTISYPADATVKEFKVGASGTWTVYTAPAVVSDNDTVYARGTDAVGNVSNVTSIVVSNIYKIAPVTVATLSPAAPNGKNSWYRTDVTVSLSVSANVYGGAAITEYQVNAGAWITYTGSIPAFGDGTYKFGYRSKDQAGNVEQIKTVEFKVDKMAPLLTIQLDQTSIWPANHKMVTIHATLNSSDATSGVESVVLTSITSNQQHSGQGDFQANLGTAATSFSLRAEKSRIYTITYTATDKAGNKTVTYATVTVPHDQSDNH